MIHASLDGCLRTLRIILAGMLASIVGFGAIAAALAVNGSAKIDSQSANTLLLVLAGFAVSEIVAYAVVRTAFVGNLRSSVNGQALEEDRTQQLIKSFHTLTLIGAAMVEGVSILGLVVLILSASWLAVPVPAVGLVLIVLQFPTRDKFYRFAGNVTGEHWG